MTIADGLWQELLELKEKNVTVACLGWSYDGTAFSQVKDIEDIDSDAQALLLKANIEHKIKSVFVGLKNIAIPFESLTLYVSDSINTDVLSILKNYWPLSVLGHLNTELPYIFIHSAISLDGYLATKSGHSRWIGNEENLIHAHRLRALFDAVLVGSKTVLNDKPSLNVRHVKGVDPKRLILSNKNEDFSALKNIPNTTTFLLRDIKYNHVGATKHFDKTLFFEGESKRDKMLDLLQKCKNENINSILIEGGSDTLSTFIETKLASNIQFHISPLLFGSGIKAVQLPTVNLVNENHKLKDMCITPIGNSFMVTASLA